MNHVYEILVAIVVMLAVIVSGCSCDAKTGNSQIYGSPAASRSEHNRGDGEHGGEGHAEHDRGDEDHYGKEGEESAAERTLNERYDEVRNGVRLILAYDAESNSFNGTVENITDKTLRRVRVEVQLSNKRELGPTTPADLNPGEKRSVTLAPK